MYKRIFNLTFNIELAPLDTLRSGEEEERGRVMGIGEDELGALIRLFERALQELDVAVREKGEGGVGRVVLQTRIDGVDLRGVFEVRELVDGVVVGCRG